MYHRNRTRMPIRGRAFILAKAEIDGISDAFHRRLYDFVVATGDLPEIGHDDHAELGAVLKALSALVAYPAKDCHELATKVRAVRHYTALKRRLELEIAYSLFDDMIRVIDDRAAQGEPEELQPAPAPEANAVREVSEPEPEAEPEEVAPKPKPSAESEEKRRRAVLEKRGLL